MIEKVDVAIIGFQKAGTTSIKNYLGDQPGFTKHYQKEMTYFSNEEEYKLGWEKAESRYFHNIKKKERVLIKHSTLIRYEKNIERLYKHNPDIKIIVCLRNPVERAYSSYLMEKSNGNLTLPFEVIIKKAFENYNKGISDWKFNVFVKIGQYSDYVETLIKYFKREQIYFLWIEKFYENREKGLLDVCNWLDIKKPNIGVISKNHNVHKETRFLVFSRLISKLLANKSLIRTVANHIIPMHKHNYWGDKLRNIAKREAKKEPLNENIADFLSKHYYPYNEKLLEIIKG